MHAKDIVVLMAYSGIVLGIAGIIIAIKAIIFERKTPSWFREAMASDKWKTKVLRTPLPAKEEQKASLFCISGKSNAEVVIPTFTLTNSQNNRLLLTREKSKVYTEADVEIPSAVTYVFYKNIMTINDQPISKDQAKYRDILMKRLCRSAGINS